MTATNPDGPYGWHDEAITWAELKVAFALALSVALGVVLLF